MMLLPIILRLLARFEGIPKHTGLELSLMTRFFIFQVIVSEKFMLVIRLLIVFVALLPHCHPLVWNRCCLASTYQRSYFHPEHSCSKSPIGFYILPHVSRRSSIIHFF